MRLAGMLAVLGLMVCPAAAAANPISFFYDFRSTTVLAHVRDGSGDFRQTDHDYQADDLRSSATVSTPSSTASAAASLISDLSNPTHLWGDGVAGSSFDTRELGDVSAAATYYVGLHLEQPYTFSFSGQFASTGRNPFDPSGPNVQARWQVQLHRTGGLVVMNQTSTDAAAFAQTGTLSAGDWYLLVDGAATGYTPRDAIGSSLAQYVFSMDLAPVTTSPSPTPEPASLLLLGSGAAASLAARRRRATSAGRP